MGNCWRAGGLSVKARPRALPTYSFINFLRDVSCEGLCWPMVTLGRMNFIECGGGVLL